METKNIEVLVRVRPQVEREMGTDNVIDINGKVNQYALQHIQASHSSLLSFPLPPSPFYTLSFQ
jgi:hypothetical protein